MAVEFLTTEEACSILKVSRRTLYRRLNAGEIEGRKLGGQWRFHPDEIARLVPAPKPPRTALQRMRACVFAFLLLASSQEVGIISAARAGLRADQSVRNHYLWFRANLIGPSYRYDKDVTAAIPAHENGDRFVITQRTSGLGVGAFRFCNSVARQEAPIARLTVVVSSDLLHRRRGHR